MHEIATQLRIYGITFAIDDFGEGFSSFARLRDVPFVELKLDRSFVRDSGSDPRNAGICQTIVNLAHNFGALAVAEGLENAADLHAMQRMGCDIGQGFFLARPMPKASFVRPSGAARVAQAAVLSLPACVPAKASMALGKRLTLPAWRAILNSIRARGDVRRAPNRSDR
jgi:EAL domain-containing protein (putative c-di-GMP-specific phosphodiesterase class I)